jgi:Reprolysin family propeptide.
MRRGLSRLMILCAVALFTIGAVEAATVDGFDRRRLDPLSRPHEVGERVDVGGVILGPREVLDLELRRIEVFAPDAQIVVHGAGGRITHGEIPKLQYYGGMVAGDPESAVVMAVGSDGVRGLILRADRAVSIGRRPGSSNPDDYVSEEVSFDEIGRSVPKWHCDVDDVAMTIKSLHPSSLPVPRSSASATHGVRMAIDMDYELYVKLGGTAALTKYVGDLVAAASTIYSRDVATTMVVGNVEIWTTPSDPWSATTTADALTEVSDYWATNAGRKAIARSGVAFLSGRSIGGGRAWLGEICSGDTLCPAPFWCAGHYFGAYAVMGVQGNFDLANPYATWDVVVFSHEVGHNFGSPHTHCYSPPVDPCYSGESSSCYNGPTSVPPERGTIMSYCHLLNGGMSNVRLIFGASNEVSKAVNDLISSSIATAAPDGLVTAPQTACPGTSGLLASVPDAGSGATYVWTIANGSITGGASTRSVTFSAGINGPLTLGVTVSHPNGCATTDHATASVNGATTTIAAPATVCAGSSGNSASVTPMAGATYTWSATNGTIT